MFKNDWFFQYLLQPSFLNPFQMKSFFCFCSPDHYFLRPNLNVVPVSRCAPPPPQALLGDRSPFHMLARWIMLLPWGCVAKRLFFAGLLRIALDLAEIAA